MESIESLPTHSMSAAGTQTVVTGANSGIGFEIAKQSIAAGGTVWVAARTLPKSTETAVALGDGARAIQFDVTDPESITAAATQLRTLDILINNAGINPGNEELTAATLDQIRAAYETNVFGVIAVTQSLLPVLSESAHPRIVNVSSGTGSLT